MFKYLPKIVFGLSALLAVEIISLVIIPSASAAKLNKQETPASPAIPPATTNILDLTKKGSSGFINQALFQQISDTNAAGTGKIDSFLRIHALGNEGKEQGYNTDYRGQGGNKMQFDENQSPQFTRSLLLKDVPIVKVGDVNYRQFILDINEPNAGNKALITLDSMKIFLGNAPDLHNYSASTGFGANAAQIYDLDAGVDSTINLSDLNSGSGRYDMFAYVPDELFKASSNPYVYLYSSFQDKNDANGGFEEWAVNKATVIVPEQEPRKVFEPSAGTAFLLATLGMFRTRRRKKQIA